MLSNEIDIKKEKNRAYMVYYYAANYEKVKERSKKYYENNSEKLKESSKKYYENNSEKLKESSKKYRENNPEKVKEKAKKWKENNHEKVKKYTNKISNEMGDSYIKNKLCTITKNSLHVGDLPNELIEVKRLQIQLFRLIKNKEN